MKLFLVGLLAIAAGVLFAVACVPQQAQATDQPHVIHCFRVCYGTNKSDVMEGTEGANTMHARAGGDFLAGFSGRDSLIGNRGADVLNGCRGEDLLTAGNGNDTIFAQEGNKLKNQRTDYIFCGDGEDTVYVWSISMDQVSDDCEYIFYEKEVNAGSAYETHTWRCKALFSWQDHKGCSYA